MKDSAYGTDVLDVETTLVTDRYGFKIGWRGPNVVMLLDAPLSTIKTSPVELQFCTANAL